MFGLIATAAAQPVNDECSGAIALLDGDTPFSTAQATSSGPAACGSVGSDIWYLYTAECSGTLRIETCDLASYDTVLVAYAAGACPPVTQLTCNDDFCGLQSTITFPVVTGTPYLIRVGGFGGASGTGTLRVTPPDVSGFTYQGRLEQDSIPIDQPADLRFRVWDAPTGGTPLSLSATINNVPVDEGTFTVKVPFGAEIFESVHCRWLEIAVRVPAGSGSFVTLSPRQEIGATPAAIRAAAADTVLWNSIAGIPPGLADGIDDVGAGDITAVTAGTGLTGGGTSGAVSLAASFGGNGGATTVARSDHFHSSLDASDGSPADALLVNASGLVGVGTTTPDARLHVNGGQDASLLPGSGFLVLGDVAGANLVFDNNEILARNGAIGSLLAIQGEGTGNIALCGGGGNVGIGLNSNDARLHVQHTGRPIKCDRAGSDGELLAWARDDTVVGLVTVAVGTVSYGAFTGSHWARLDQPAKLGEIVSLTGENQRLGSGGEPVYGAALTTRVNDPASFGAYLAPLTSETTDIPADCHQVMSVGNGEMWVVDTGGDIAPGDLLISSHVAGCAMKDDPARFPVGYVVARAAERVTWADIEPDTAGQRRALISVLFDRFTRTDAGRVAELEERVRKLEEALARLAEAKD